MYLRHIYLFTDKKSFLPTTEHYAKERSKRHLFFTLDSHVTNAKYILLREPSNEYLASQICENKEKLDKYKRFALTVNGLSNNSMKGLVYRGDIPENINEEFMRAIIKYDAATLFCKIDPNEYNVDDILEAVIEYNSLRIFSFIVENYPVQVYTRISDLSSDMLRIVLKHVITVDNSNMRAPIISNLIKFGKIKYLHNFNAKINFAFLQEIDATDEDFENIFDIQQRFDVGLANKFLPIATKQKNIRRIHFLISRGANNFAEALKHADSDTASIFTERASKQVLHRIFGMANIDSLTNAQINGCLAIYGGREFTYADVIFALKNRILTYDKLGLALLKGLIIAMIDKCNIDGGMKIVIKTHKGKQGITDQNIFCECLHRLPTGVLESLLNKAQYTAKQLLEREIENRHFK